MVRIRKTYRKRPTRKYGKRMTKRMSTIKRSTPTIRVARKFFTSTWNWGTASTVDFWRYYIIKPSDMPNWGEYSAVFDEYRINAVKVTFLPRYDSVDASSSTVVPNAHIIIDPASTMIPSGTYTSANLNTLLENSGVRTKRLNKPVSVYFKPKIAIQAFGGATNVLQTSTKFLKTNDTSVDYRGFHIFVQPTNFDTPTNCKLDVFYTYYVTFRNTR